MARPAIATAAAPKEARPRVAAAPVAAAAEPDAVCDVLPPLAAVKVAVAAVKPVPPAPAALVTAVIVQEQLELKYAVV